MKTIWKYSLPDQTRFMLDLPSVHRILAVQVQGDDVCLWALVDTETPKVPVAFRVLLTGAEIDQWEFRGGAEYIGTFQRDWFVGHLFWVVG